MHCNYRKIIGLHDLLIEIHRHVNCVCFFLEHFDFPTLCTQIYMSLFVLFVMKTWTFGQTSARLGFPDIIDFRERERELFGCIFTFIPVDFVQTADLKNNNKKQQKNQKRASKMVASKIDRPT